METSPLAGIEYHGLAGSSEDCQTAVVRLLQCGVPLASARVITSGNTHCLFLTNEVGDQIAVKSGFSSGYGGGGPTSFSITLQLLSSHGVEIDEWLADDDLLNRLDKSALTMSDVEAMVSGRAVRPTRWPEYIFERHYERAKDGTLWHDFSPLMPLSIVDARIMDLAKDFWSDPDARLLRGYRRLEDSVRARTGIDESSAKLFSSAFLAKDAPLTWGDRPGAETIGRGQLFAATFMAYRNPRAHQETPKSELLAEFLLLNQLFRLEAEAVLADRLEG